MNASLLPDMLEATRLTRSGRLVEAAALLRRRLAGDAPATAPAPQAGLPRLPAPEASPGATPWPAGRWTPSHHPLPAAHPLPTRGLKPGTRPEPPLPPGARFLEASFSGAAGRCAYKLYIPSQLAEPAPLVVMLHGCTQSPDDFAAGTRMNALAEAQGFLVVYPAQAPGANAQKCWNWFRPGDQSREQGEPALIAGITRQVMREQPVDPARVYVAGLSAGGAAAAIMACAYPDLYAAAGVHSGLACGAARDLPSALAAMRQGAAGMTPQAGIPVPTIVFHADRDTTVHPRNGDQVIAQSGLEGLSHEVQQGQVPGGHAYRRTIHRDGQGHVVREQWLVHGGGHAWSGGSSAGSYTDPLGPDASAEMLRFFLEHPRPGAPRA
jgi:poly(hydroxyalkanoate) depolymerase family esterase